MQNNKVKQPPTIDELGFKGLKVIVGKDDNIESAVKKFKKLVIKDGVIAEWKKHAFYESPSVARKKKMQANQRKLQRKMNGK